MGGNIVNSIIKKSPKRISTPMKKPIKPSFIILSPCAMRTFKYLLGLGARLPCIHYYWIAICYKYETYIDPIPYLLPAGMTLEKQLEKIPSSVINQYPVDITQLTFYDSSTSDQFRIEIVGSTDFKEQWSQVIYEGGGKLVTRLFSSIESRIDFILSDSEPTEIVINKAKSLGQPLCSIEWLIQSLISQKVQNPNSHNEYRVTK